VGHIGKCWGTIGFRSTALEVAQQVHTQWKWAFAMSVQDSGFHLTAIAYTDNSKNLQENNLQSRGKIEVFTPSRLRSNYRFNAL
jgi:hypothetical protein